MRAISEAASSIIANENHIRAITDNFDHLDALMEMELSNTDCKKLSSKDDN